VPSHAGSSDEQSRHKFVIGRTLPTNLTLSSISIALPIFMIHGNHDDPSGLENVSNVDILAANNLV
jgi:double-strand break repair protein MRE11